MNRYSSFLSSRLLTCLGAFAFCWIPTTELIAKTKIDFNREIRPILSDNCFQCHGPDEKTRKAKLRLDTPEGLAKVVDLKQPEKSELLVRIHSTDKQEVMPPPSTGKKITPQQSALLKEWISQGAEYQAHWAFIPPKKVPVPASPEAAKMGWQQNPLDAFLYHSMLKQGLSPSPRADRSTLIRRVTLDLTGLPPTPEEVDAFLKDNSPDAYEKLVERLLKSPRYGERMTLDWLDAARYADTHGYHIDSGRDMTRWRDWVIRAFNENKPYDQFTIEQIAGDLLPNATIQQKIASGFNRNHMINFEGGAIPEEYQTAYVVDRVNTTATVFLGLTMACAQCHDHKYDPISQRDFYRFYAFFNNVPERGLDGNKGNAVPLLKAPSDEMEKLIASLREKLSNIEKKFSGDWPEADQAQAEWEKMPKELVWNQPKNLSLVSQGKAKITPQKDGSYLLSGPNPATDVLTFKLDKADSFSALKLEVLPDDSLTAKGPGRSSNGNLVLTGFKILRDGKPLKLKKFSADFSQETFPASELLNSNKGWAIYPQVGKPHFLVAELSEATKAGDDLTVIVEFNSPFAQHTAGKVRLSQTDHPQPHGAGLSAEISTALKIPMKDRTEAQKKLVREFFRKNVFPLGRELDQGANELRQEINRLISNVPDSMVMEEMPKPRDTFILERGQYDKKGEKVTAGVPSALPPLPKDAPVNRLGLAQWLVSAEQPLTARVTVNRYWQMFFGTGLVKSSEDFGSQGELPSHPELLDWLAVDFRESGWDVKRLVKMIVTSQAYQQSSAVTKEHLAKDPENRLLARQSRLRLPAEFIRDQALAVSGLLNPEIGGKSVSPYQPAGIWEELASRADGDNWTAQKYKQDKGKDLYRRTMYTFWKRTAPPPSLMTFDAPDRETCVVRRARTNTPLQALVTMNDPTYVEASRKLAERIIKEGGNTTESRIQFAFKLLAARSASEKELGIIRRLLEAQTTAFNADKLKAKKLLQVGESPVDEKLDEVELAAWTLVANALLNLDEMINRG